MAAAPSEEVVEVEALVVVEALPEVEVEVLIEVEEEALDAGAEAQAGEVLTEAAEEVVMVTEAEAQNIHDSSRRSGYSHVVEEHHPRHSRRCAGFHAAGAEVEAHLRSEEVQSLSMVLQSPTVRGHLKFPSRASNVNTVTARRYRAVSDRATTRQSPPL